VLDNLSESGQPLMGVPPPLGELLAPGRPPLGPLVGGLSDLLPPPPSASGGPAADAGGMAELLAPLLRPSLGPPGQAGPA
jgi:hypothetical protein